MAIHVIELLRKREEVERQREREVARDNLCSALAIMCSYLCQNGKTGMKGGLLRRDEALDGEIKKDLQSEIKS